ncbi:MAG: hypothetical protein ABSA62_04920 [Methyloceanibacter sp.]
MKPVSLRAASGDARPAQADQSPVDLLGAARIDAAAERGRDRLRAEADADQRRAVPERRLDRGEFVSQEGVAGDLIDADRAAEHDEEIGALRVRQIVDARLQIAKRDATRSEDVLERAASSKTP